MAAFQQQLKQLGWLDGHNIQIDLVWGGADIDHIRTSALKMVNSKPDVIFVYSVRVLNPVRQATREIPVVFIATNDPVGLGIVKSLSHPGGNLTGFTLYEVSMAGKLVELLKEMVPNLQGWPCFTIQTTAAHCHIGVLSKPSLTPMASPQFRFPSMTPPASNMLSIRSRVSPMAA